MHEQEFERSVQQKMEELSFAPSVPVWEKLEKELRATKRKRRFALWLLPVVISGLALGYWMWSGTALFNNQNQISENKKDQKQVITGQDKNTEVNKQDKLFTEDKLEQQEAAINAEEKKAESSNSLSNQQSKRHAGVDAFVKIDKKHTIKTSSKQNRDDIEGTGFDLSENSKTDINAFLPENTKAQIPLLTVSRSTRLQQLQGRQHIQPVLTPQLIKDAAVARWQWGFDAQYGSAGVSAAGLFLTEGTDRLSDPAPNSPGSFNGGSSAQHMLQTAPGTFLSTSFNLQRSLTYRVSISAGIRYSLYTLRLRVGEKINPGTISLGNASAEAMLSQALYKPDTANAYFKSRYHQVSLPLTLQVRPFKNVPLEAAAGVALGYLSGSKTLRYDTAARLYYVTKPDVQHLQAQALAAVRYRLAQSGKWQWLAVTQMHYHLSHFNAAAKGGKKLYALSAGIQIRKK